MPGSHEDDQPGFAWCRQFKDFLTAAARRFGGKLRILDRPSLQPAGGPSITRPADRQNLPSAWPVGSAENGGERFLDRGGTFGLFQLVEGPEGGLIYVHQLSQVDRRGDDHHIRG